MRSEGLKENLLGWGRNYPNLKTLDRKNFAHLKLLGEIHNLERTDRDQLTNARAKAFFACNFAATLRSVGLR